MRDLSSWSFRLHLDSEVTLGFFEVEYIEDLFDNYRMEAIELILVIDEYTITRLGESEMADMVNVVEIIVIN